MRFFPLVDLIMMQAWRPYVGLSDVFGGSESDDKEKNGVRVIEGGIDEIEQIMRGTKRVKP